jgi:hypothetical protein
MFMQRGAYRQPWAPAIPSTLGTSRPAMYQMAQPGAAKSDDGVSEHGIDIHTNPATPVKADNKADSPVRREE